MSEFEEADLVLDFDERISESEEEENSQNKPDKSRRVVSKENEVPESSGIGRRSRSPIKSPETVDKATLPGTGSEPEPLETVVAPSSRWVKS